MYTRGMRRLKLISHQSVEEVEAAYRGSSEGIGRSQWQIIWLLARGEPSETVAEMTGYSQAWIRTIAHRYNAGGAAAIGDQRHHNPGRAPSLPVYQQQTLKSMLSAAAARGEAWSGVEVAAWMSERLGRNVYAQRGWEMLRRLDFRPKVGRPRHIKADVADQDAYKKRSRSPRKPGQ
jgi:transposase